MEVMGVSVLILTLNEEANLPDCLASVSWSDDVVVFDSYSSDRTVQIARAAGARVVQRPFDDYASQRNAALTQVQYQHPWVLLVDADERWPREIYEEIQEAISRDGDISIYYFLRKDMFLGRWMRHTGYPTWAGRLLKLGDVTVARAINEQYLTTGNKGYLQGHFIHHPFHRGVAHWLHRHNQYSSMEAEALVGRDPRSSVPAGHLLPRAGATPAGAETTGVSPAVPARPRVLLPVSSSARVSGRRRRPGLLPAADDL